MTRFVPFAPQPDPRDIPETFPTPFAQEVVHPVADRAARECQAFIDQHPDLEEEMFRGSLGGKMFGVLVVRRPDGAFGYYRAFAGTLGDRRDVAGFVPPAFDVKAYDALWGSEGAAITAFSRALERMDPSSQDAKQLAAEQRERSQALLPRLRETYRLCNARGEALSLDAVFAPRTPPGGAGDCAAPKLLRYAFACGDHPVALAEFWWGNATPGGGRHHGVYYPACRGKCSRLLPAMLDGIEVDPPPLFGTQDLPDEAPIGLFEDADLLVVDKPAGMLSVPGRGNANRDCAQARLLSRTAGLEDGWPRLVHRLDQPTSGVLLAAKHKAAYVNVQQQFSRRTIQKRYIAVLAGNVRGERGRIELPLRVDIDDRPRQIHDPEHGKPAVTDWEVIERSQGQTRVLFSPRTGRTHQLRVHAAHERGLGCPIVGDPLYGFGGPRLYLHAESLRLRHPTHDRELQIESPCPF